MRDFMARTGGHDREPLPMPVGEAEQQTPTVLIPKLVPGDDVEAFLQVFELVWVGGHPPAQWVLCLLPLPRVAGSSPHKANRRQPVHSTQSCAEPCRTSLASPKRATDVDSGISSGRKAPNHLEWPIPDGPFQMAVTSPTQSGTLAAAFWE